MENKLYCPLCPLVKDMCFENACAWYSENYSSCSVLLLAETMQDATTTGGTFRITDDGGDDD